MKLELIQITSTDNLQLPGLFYTPTDTSKTAAIWLHGMGDNGIFYKPKRINELGKSLNKRGIALLAFNNRGAHNQKKLSISDETLPEEDRVYTGGTHYEKIADSIYDIDGAVSFLQNLGYRNLYIIGHSSGANKICSYVFQKKNSPFKKYVLAGPGDDSGLFYSELGEKKYRIALAYAKKHVAQNKAVAVMPKYTGMYPFSAQAALDILDPNGDYNTFPFYEATSKRLGTKPLFKEFAYFDKPILTIIGELDKYTYTAGGIDGAFKLIHEALPIKIRHQCASSTVKGADHGFTDHETEFAETVATWLDGGI